MVGGVDHHIGRVQITRHDAAAVQCRNVDGQVVGHQRHGLPGPAREHLGAGIAVNAAQHILGVDPGHDVTHHPAIAEQDVLRPGKAPVSPVAGIEFELQHGLQLALLIGAVFGGGGVPVLMVDLCHQCRFSLQGIDAAFSAGAARLLQTVIPRSAAQGHAAVIFFYRHV